MTRRERLERKLEKRQEWAQKAQGRSEAGFSGVQRIADAIPFGQPILVGHHSERHARRDQDRIHRGMTRGREEQRLAQHHEERAAGLEIQLEKTIFSDDHDAVEQLEARIASLEADAAKQTEWNTLWKRGAAAGEKAATKAGKTGAEDLLIARLDGGEKALRDAGVSQTIIAAANTVMEQGYSWIKSPFDLTSTRANVRRLKERLEDVNRQRARRQAAEEAGGVSIVRNEAHNWCRITFAEKPDYSIIQALKAAGFIWGAGCWDGALDRLPAEVTAAVQQNGANRCYAE